MAVEVNGRLTGTWVDRSLNNGLETDPAAPSFLKAAPYGVERAATVAFDVSICNNARTVVFFPGDCVEGAGSDRVDNLSRPDVIIKLLKEKLAAPQESNSKSPLNSPPCCDNFYVVYPSRYEGPFACFDSLFSEHHGSSHTRNVKSKNNNPQTHSAANLFRIPSSNPTSASARRQQWLRTAGLTASGDPLGYSGEGLHTAASLLTLLRRVSRDVDAAATTACQQDQNDGSLDSEDASKAATSACSCCPRAAFCSESRQGWRSVLLVGFSKGGVVLNQLLAEAAEPLAREPCGFEPAAAGAPLDEAEHFEVAWNDKTPPGEAKYSEAPQNVKASAGEAAHRAASSSLPGSPADFLAAVDAWEFVDVGLNCRGAHVTSPAVLTAFVRNAAVRAGGGDRATRSTVVHLHGSPRQWMDARRPWVAEEKGRFMRFVGDAIAALTREKGRCPVQATETLYFADSNDAESKSCYKRWRQSAMVGLEMHFGVLDKLSLL